MVDPHTVATFAFAMLARDPELRRRRWWLPNTLVCVESDLIADVLYGSAEHYFPEGDTTLAVYYPDQQQFMFVNIVPKEMNKNTLTLEESRRQAGKLTMHRIIERVYAGKVDRGDLPFVELPRPDGSLVHTVSTAEIERRLVLS